VGAGRPQGQLIAARQASIGIPLRQGFKGSKAHTTTGEKIGALPERIQHALRLQMAFELSDHSCRCHRAT
jgi:hypothetical protein